MFWSKNDEYNSFFYFAFVKRNLLLFMMVLTKSNIVLLKPPQITINFLWEKKNKLLYLSLFDQNIII